ncbi:MAG TPA: RnfABCDGE type electron transport complex subunit D [Acholeplasmataceae bacterium]|nr:RnfABCDGE type electron transport complex subunit D [Acholeplasmataceae bacterium]
MARRFALGKAPFQRITDEKRLSTSQIMRDFIIALVPLILFGWVKNGLLPFIREEISVIEMLYPLILILVGALTSVVSEVIFFYVWKKTNTWEGLKKELSLSYGVIPGLLIAMIVPIYTPVWVLMLGCVVANILFKMLFGGFGHNILNPALMGYAFITTAFYGVITSSVGQGFFLPSELASGATPLQNLAGLGSVTNPDVLISPYGSLLDFFLGTVPGGLAETSSLLIILSCIFLIARKVISWVIPVIYVGTVFVLTLIIGLISTDNGLTFALFNVLSGGLLFGAVFMATEPVTSPKTPNGKVIFALLLGVLTVLFRLSGKLPEGVATSILLLNLFVPMIDRFAATIRAKKINRQVILKYVGMGVFILLLAFYTVFHVTNKYEKKDIAKAEVVEVIE